MKTPINFQPTKNPRLADKTPLPKVQGFLVSYGLVIHRSLYKLREQRGYWDVSDLQTGCLVAMSDFPGQDGAIAALVERAMEFKNRPGGFRGALERGRAKTLPVLNPVQAGIGRTTSGAIGQP